MTGTWSRSSRCTPQSEAGEGTEVGSEGELYTFPPPALGCSQLGDDFKGNSTSTHFTVEKMMV